MTSWTFSGASNMPSPLRLSLGYLWCQSSPLGRMSYFTKLRTVLAPGCAGSRTGCKRSCVFPFRSSMAAVSSSTALVFYPTAGPSPLWVSQDPGGERGGYRERGLGCELQGDTGMGQTHPGPHGAHTLDWDMDTQADNLNMR